MKSTTKTPKKVLNAELVTAVWGNNLEEAKALIKQGANVNFHTIDGHYKKSLLMTAIEFGHLAMSRLLIKSGADANLVSFCKDKRVFCTPLQRILEVGGSHDIEHVIRDLVERGADINIVDYEGVTPLTAVILSKNKIKTALLIEFGAELKLGKSNMDDALHVAKITNQPEVYAMIEDLLLSKVANSSSNHFSDQNTEEHVKPTQRARL